MRIVRLADCQPAPWKNGAGSTRELWRINDAAGLLIRISVAEITGDQPFSSFPGIDRTILQLDGPPMVLQVNGQERGIVAPLDFAGEASVTCRLSAPGTAHDLNLMVRRGAYRGGMAVRPVLGGEPLRIGMGGQITGLVALTDCDLGGDIATRLDRHDLLIATGPAMVTPREAARFAVLTMTA